MVQEVVNYRWQKKSLFIDSTRSRYLSMVQEVVIYRWYKKSLFSVGTRSRYLSLVQIRVNNH